MSQISKETSANYQIIYRNSSQPSFSPFTINPFETQRKRTEISRSQVFAGHEGLFSATLVFSPGRFEIHEDEWLNRVRKEVSRRKKSRGGKTRSLFARHGVECFLDIWISAFRWN